MNGDDGLTEAHLHRGACSGVGTLLGEIPHPDPVILCRCGQSGNKPFCDGTHLTIDFDGTLAS